MAFCSLEDGIVHGYSVACDGVLADVCGCSVHAEFKRSTRTACNVLIFQSVHVVQTFLQSGAQIMTWPDTYSTHKVSFS